MRPADVSGIILLNILLGNNFCIDFSIPFFSLSLTILSWKERCFFLRSFHAITSEFPTSYWMSRRPQVVSHKLRLEMFRQWKCKNFNSEGDMNVFSLLWFVWARHTFCCEHNHIFIVSVTKLIVKSWRRGLEMQWLKTFAKPLCGFPAGKAFT